MKVFHGYSWQIVKTAQPDLFEVRFPDGAVVEGVRAIPAYGEMPASCNEDPILRGPGFFCRITRSFLKAALECEVGAKFRNGCPVPASADRKMYGQ
jgi:hypothetical protein